MKIRTKLSLLIIYLGVYYSSRFYCFQKVISKTEEEKYHITSLNDIILSSYKYEELKEKLISTTVETANALSKISKNINSIKGQIDQ